MQLTRTQKKDFIIVTVILGLMLGVNLSIYHYFTVEVGSNSYEIPDQSSPLYPQLLVILVLDKNFSYASYSVVLLNETNDFIAAVTLRYYGMRNGKYLHTANFTSVIIENTSGYFKFYFEIREWYSDPVRINEEWRFEWI